MYDWFDDKIWASVWFDFVGMQGQYQGHMVQGE